VLLLVKSACFAQANKYTISGAVRDSTNGEDIVGTLVALPNSAIGIATNAYGFYSLTLPAGAHTLRISYMGMQPKEISVDLTQNRTINILLQSEAQQIEEVVVSAERRNANVSKPEMSVERLSASVIKKIPVLMGETDVIKAIQLLPGVQATSEGSSGFSVRGGGYDQNLIMLDEATVYSASHLMGFFSVFNNDAIKDVTLHKGDIPVFAGGRLASLRTYGQKTATTNASAAQAA
jgi:hypothetical protein